MEFHFVKLLHTGTYLNMVDPKQKPRFVCFAEKGTAKSYINYAADFRARTRIWPCLDMSSETRKLEVGTQISIPYGRPEQIKRYLDIETFDFGSLDKIANMTNISFYCILNFDVQYNIGDSETVTFSGQEMDGIGDPKDFGDWMDYSLKTK
jgi:hypothetical protein